MPRHLEKPVNRFIQDLLDECKTTELTKVAEKKKLSRRRLERYAQIFEGHREYEALLRDAEALGITVDELLRRLLNRAS